MAKVRIESPQESPKVYDVRGEKEITVKTKNETPEVTVGGGGGGGGDGIGCLGCLVLLFLLRRPLCRLGGNMQGNLASCRESIRNESRKRHMASK